MAGAAAVAAAGVAAGVGAFRKNLLVFMNQEIIADNG